MNRMQRRAVVRLILALALVVLCLEAQGQSILRLHVIANSNSAEDQRVKLLVRDAVLASEREAFCFAQDANGAQDAVIQNGAGILAAAQGVLREENAAYGAQLRLGRYEFPEKTYGSDVYPAGRYDALKIVLGDGAGDNWWCVMFPPLCLIDLDSPDGPGGLGELSEEQKQEILKAEKTVHFKSILKELFEKWVKGGEE